MANPRQAVIAAALLSLAACVPHFTTYVHLRTSEIVPVACGSAGPPVFARYERAGARFEVTLEPGLAAGAQGGFLRVRAPAGVPVVIPDPAGYVSLENGDPPIRFRLALAQAANSGGMTEHRFDFDGLPAKIDFGGVLHLPDVIVDGKTIVSPVFEFYRQRYAGAAPRDCPP